MRSLFLYNNEPRSLVRSLRRVPLGEKLGDKASHPLLEVACESPESVCRTIERKPGYKNKKQIIREFLFRMGNAISKPDSSNRHDQPGQTRNSKKREKSKTKPL